MKIIGHTQDGYVIEVLKGELLPRVTIPGYVERLESDLFELRRREADLLAANNIELEKRRAAEAKQAPDGVEQRALLLIARVIHEGLYCLGVNQARASGMPCYEMAPLAELASQVAEEMEKRS